MARIPKSIIDPLKQPLSLFVAVIGGLSLFNLMREVNIVSDETLVVYVDCIYATSRDFVFAPIEALIGIGIPAWLKNIFVIYAVLARAYTSSIGFLILEMKSSPERDPYYRTVTKSYPPLENGPIQRKLAFIDAAVKRVPISRLQPLSRKVLMTLSSFLWPYGLRSALAHPALDIKTEGPDEVGAPHPSNPNEVELPPLGEHGGYEYSPKFPAAGSDVLPEYNARQIFMTFILSQILVSAVLAFFNAILPEIENLEICVTESSPAEIGTPNTVEGEKKSGNLRRSSVGLTCSPPSLPRLARARCRAPARHRGRGPAAWAA